MSGKRIVVDFDNTMGIPGCDVDDGLALLYLLGNPELAHIEGVCTSYGNSSLETVHANTQRMLGFCEVDIPLYKGAQDAFHPLSEASEYMVDLVNTYPQEISFLATGSLTNFKGASILDPTFFSKVKEISLMGGITQSLVFNGIIMDELNFSCDPQATKEVLGAPVEVMVATSQNCLPAHFFPDEFEKKMRWDSQPDGGYIYRLCEPWFKNMKERYLLDGFCCWDVVAAACLIQPELFHDALHEVTLNEKLLSIGYLEKACEGYASACIHTPSIKNAQSFKISLYESWQRALPLFSQKAHL